MGKDNSTRNFGSYNGEPLKEGQVLVPWWFDRGFKRDLGSAAIDENFRTITFCGITFLIGYVAVDESIAGELMKIFGQTVNERLDLVRPGRCVIGNNADGSPRTCPRKNNCTNCKNRGVYPRQNTKNGGAHMSLDFCFENEDFDIPDNEHPSPEDEVLLRILLSDLLEYLDKKYPRYSEIVRLSLAGLENDEIIAQIGLKKSRGYQEINNALKLVKMFLHND